MSIKITISWACPYCKKAQYSTVDFETQDSIIRRIASCDTKQGGCGRLAVLESALTVHTRIFEVNAEPKDQWNSGQGFDDKPNEPPPF